MTAIGTYTKVAKYSWPHAAWIFGDGRWASLARCVPLTVMLFETLDAAESAQAQIDRTGCGSNCTRRHEIVDMDQYLP